MIYNFDKNGNRIEISELVIKKEESPELYSVIRMIYQRKDDKNERGLHFQRAD